MATVVVPIKAKDETKAGIQRAQNSFKGFATNVASFAGALGIGKAIGLIGDGIGAAFGATTDFDAALTDITSRVQLTADEIDVLSDAMFALGRDTKFSATEAADGFLELVTSGSSAEEALATIPHVLNLAAASGLELGAAADTVTDIMAQFGLNVSEAVNVVDSLTATAGSSSATVSDLAQAMANVGPVAANFGLSVDDTNAALAILAENGIKGAEAGTLLRTFLTNATRETDSVTEAWKALGTSFYDAEGNARPLTDVLKEMNEGLAGLPAEEANRLLTDLAGTYGLAGAHALISADGLDAMDAAMESQRSAAEVAGEQMNTMQAAIDSLGSSLETLSIKILLPFIQDVLTPLANHIADAVNAFSDWTDSESAAGVFGIIGGAIETLVANLENLRVFVSSVLAGDWNTAFEAMQAYTMNAFNQIAGFLLTTAGGMLTNFGEFFSGLITGAVQSLDFFVRLWQRAFNSVRAVATNIMIATIQVVEDAINAVLALIRGLIVEALRPFSHGVAYEAIRPIVGDEGLDAFAENFRLQADFTSGLRRVTPDDFATPGLGIDAAALQQGLANTLQSAGQTLIDQGSSYLNEQTIVINQNAPIIGDERAYAGAIEELIRGKVIIAR